MGTIDDTENLLAHLFDLHALNAKRLRIVAKIKDEVAKNWPSEDESLLAAILNAIEHEQPADTIPHALSTHIPQGMTTIYRKHGLKDARRLLERLVSHENSTPDRDKLPYPYYNLSYVYLLSSRLRFLDAAYRKEMSRKALTFATKATELFQNHADGEIDCARSYCLEALIHLSCDNPRDCKTAIDNALARAPELPEARFAEGVYHLECQHFDIAIERLASAMNTLQASGQELADVTFHLGRAYQKKRLSILNATPENERAGLRSQLSGCYTSAATYLTQATELDPDFALAHFRLGQLKTETNCEAAMAHFEAALQIDVRYFDIIGQSQCSQACKGCSGTKLKMLLMGLLGPYRNRYLRSQMQSIS
ncbi:MAG: hypothetical protein HN700_12230 [Verrucomicrobia bacterium]|jgi:hypothetical protein|nr:hypothetical protein [Verrucomicrobiota bacterium]